MWGGTFAVTVLGNVPLNEALDAFDIKNAGASEIATQRQLFEVPWNRLHSIRTFASCASFILAVISIAIKPAAI